MLWGTQAFIPLSKITHQVIKHQKKNTTVSRHLHTNASEYTYTYTILFILCRIISDRFLPKRFLSCNSFSKDKCYHHQRKKTFSRYAIKLAGSCSLNVNTLLSRFYEQPFGPSQELNGGLFYEGSRVSMLNFSGTRFRLPYDLTDYITTNAASMLSC